MKARFPALTNERVDAFINDVLQHAMLIRDVPYVFSLPRDKKDEPYINLAIGAGARYLVTWNDRHITYLMREGTPEGLEFRSRFPDIDILTPPAFVQRLESHDRQLELE